MTSDTMNLASLSLMYPRLEPCALMKAFLYSCHDKMRSMDQQKMTEYLIINVDNRVK
jgi:hypothetical protein